MMRYFASHPTAANLLMVMFLTLGFISLPDLRRETFPDFSTKKLQIKVLYPGATAEEVESAICERIEDAIEKVSFIEEYISAAQEGMAIVTVEMSDDGNFASFLNDINTEVDAIDDFPEEAEDPIVSELNRTNQVISLAVTGDMSVLHLKQYCEDLKDKIKRIPEVSQINIQGFSDWQIRIEPKDIKLRQYGISVADIADVIARQSIDLPSGSIESNERNILLRFVDERKSPREFEDLIVIGGQSGAEIRLRDIAEISYREEKPEEQIFFGKIVTENGENHFKKFRAGILQVTKTKSEDALTIVSALREFIDKERQIVPKGIDFTFTKDVSSIVNDRLQMLIKNGWQGLLLVFFTMLLFFNFRFSFWVSMGLPVSFLMALFFMPHIGYSLNMITMVGLLLALGLLMDDAIVISENIATHLQQGKSSLDAAIAGVMEVQAGVISSFLTTICIFAPISFMEGNMGKVLGVMPVILILVLTVSLIEAFLILPNHLAHSLAHVDINKKNALRRAVTNLVDGCKNIVGKIVHFLVKWNYLVFGITVMVFLISVSMLVGGVVKFQPFPEIDGNVIEARILLPQGTPLEKTQQAVSDVNKALEKVAQKFAPEPLIQGVNIQYNQNIDSNESGPHLATISVDLLNAETRKESIDEIIHVWRSNLKNIPDIIHINFKEPAIGPAGLPIDIRMYGENLDHLKAGSLEVQHWFNQFVGVYDLSDDLRPGKPEVVIHLKEGATALGLTAQMIAMQVRAAFHGKNISEIQSKGNSYEVEARFPLEDRNSLENLESFHVTTSSGKLVPFDSVAKIEYSRGFARISRVDGRRAITIQGDVNSSQNNAAEIISKFRSEFIPGFSKKYPDLVFSLEGQDKETQKTGGSLLRGLIIGLLGIFILLSIQFKSYLEPLIIMIAVPFALVGVIWGHVIMGLNLCMPSMVGFASLAGIVVNDSILLVEFVKMNIKEGMSIAEASEKASMARFRAILLTSLTTIAGLTPLLLEKSLQAQILIPLATSIVFGMIAATILVLMVIPCLYTILDDLGLARKVEKH